MSVYMVFRWSVIFAFLIIQKQKIFETKIGGQKLEGKTNMIFENSVNSN